MAHVEAPLARYYGAPPNAFPHGISMLQRLLCLTLVFACACSGPAEEDPVLALREHIEELRAQPELEVPEVEVLQILVAHADAPRMRGVTRSLEEAEKLAGELLLRIRAGEDFDTLRTQYSDDPSSGQYAMTLEPPPPGSMKFHRATMAPSFGGFSWRLESGEIGVAPYDPQKGPFGYHIIKRLR